VHNLESLVISVGEEAWCQYVPVSAPDPRHLQHRPVTRTG
jgi:hypothetical protein